MQPVKRLDDPTTPEKSGKKLWFKMAGVEIKHFGAWGAWWARIPYTNNAQNRRSGRVGKRIKQMGESFTGDSLS